MRQMIKTGQDQSPKTGFIACLGYNIYFGPINKHNLRN